MTNPFKCINVKVTVHAQTVGVCESLTMELEHEGGVEHHYDSTRGKHAVGGDRATFTVRRWFKVDADTDLFYDLFNDKTPFSMSGELDGVSGTQITLSDCLAYRYRPVYGAPNDKVGEEISVESTVWSSDIV